MDGLENVRLAGFNQHACTNITVTRLLQRYFSISHVTSGLVVVLVGYASSAAIVFQAAEAAGATPEQISSWLWALGIGMGVTCIGLSWWLRTPILTAWSTPGAALLVTSLPGLPMSEAIGAFICTALLILLTGVMGWFDRIMRAVPVSIASAMLAGVLLQFGVGVFEVLPSQPWLVGLMVLVFVLTRRWLPRFAVPLTLLAGLAIAFLQSSVDVHSIRLEWASPVWMAPTFSLSTLIGVSLPLYIVNMASQNMPGLTVLRANGYQTPASPLIGWTGLVGVLLAPFGGFSFNLAAITAAICMSPEADPDPARRYRAAIWAGVFYFCMGLLGATVVSLFGAFPRALIVTIAGLALVGTIAHSLLTSLTPERGRDAAFLTFLVTASGLSWQGIGSAFWGLVIGLAATWLSHDRTPRTGN